MLSHYFNQNPSVTLLWSWATIMMKRHSASSCTTEVGLPCHLVSRPIRSRDERILYGLFYHYAPGAQGAMRVCSSGASIITCIFLETPLM